MAYTSQPGSSQFELRYGYIRRHFDKAIQRYPELLVQDEDERDQTEVILADQLLDKQAKRAYQGGVNENYQAALISLLDEEQQQFQCHYARVQQAEKELQQEKATLLTKKKTMIAFANKLIRVFTLAILASTALLIVGMTMMAASAVFPVVFPAMLPVGLAVAGLIAMKITPFICMAGFLGMLSTRLVESRLCKTLDNQSAQKQTALRHTINQLNLPIQRNTLIVNTLTQALTKIRSLFSQQVPSTARYPAANDVTRVPRSVRQPTYQPAFFGSGAPVVNTMPVYRPGYFPSAPPQ